MYESTFSTKKNGAKPAISGRILNFISVRVCRIGKNIFAENWRWQQLAV